MTAERPEKLWVVLLEEGSEEGGFPGRRLMQNTRGSSETCVGLSALTCRENRPSRVHTLREG